MYTCTKCYQSFKNNGNLKEGIPCLIHGCTGTVGEIDEILLPVIILLNQKGYETWGCCSGHFDKKGDQYFYINFEDFVGAEKLKSVPPKFEILNSEEFLDIHLKNGFQSKDPYSLHLEILSNAVELLNWAQSLPQIYEISTGYMFEHSVDADLFSSDLEAEFGIPIVYIEEENDLGVTYHVVNLNFSSYSEHGSEIYDKVKEIIANKGYKTQPRPIK